MLGELAIVIPVYKGKYLKKALYSLAYQTNKNFTIYIGDDCSPDKIESIVEEFTPYLRIKYLKFPNNIGARHLVNQWNRCVNLTEDEKWIWLFSDDDIADPECVNMFYRTINADNCKFDVYRFNTRVIDDNEALLSESMESPFIETSENMAYEILMGKRGHSMPDHIFSKEVYKINNGFVYTDYAQAADWATFIKFSAVKGICSIPGPRVNWRNGAANISGKVSKKRHKKILGHLQFLKWVIHHFKDLASQRNSAISYEQIVLASEYNLNFVLRYHYRGISFLSCFDILSYFLLIEKNFIVAALKTARVFYDFKIAIYIINIQVTNLQRTRLFQHKRKVV